MSKNTNSVSIGSRLIGAGQPCFIIAEAGVNHNGSLELAKKLVDVAVQGGADAVKFQMRNFAHLYTGQALRQENHEDIGTQYLLSLIKDQELSAKEFSKLKDYCERKGILFLCTPWDIPSVDVLNNLGVPAFKVASADLTNFILLEHIISKRKPLILSTGMSTADEIAQSVTFLRSRRATFILLHCNSTYPAPAKDINLRCIETIRNKFRCPVGYSSHDDGIMIPTVAAALGACIIEKHITLNRAMRGPDHAMSLEQQSLTQMVRDIRDMEAALGNGKKRITRGEFINRIGLSKSLVAATSIRRGEIITRDKVVAKSPAKGLYPRYAFKLIGTKARRDMVIDDYFSLEDIERPRKLGPFRSSHRWGLIVRPHDALTITTDSNPRVMEYHLSSSDVGISWPDIPPIRNTELVIHVPELWGDRLFDLCSREHGIVKNSLKNLHSLLARIPELRKKFPDSPGRVKVIIHPGGMSYGDFVTADVRKEMYRILEHSLQRINAKGCEILLENLPPFPWYKGGAWYSNVFMDASEMAAFAKQTRYGLCYDSSHAQLFCNHGGTDPIAFLKVLLPFVKHSHISDGAGVDGEGLQIGKGEVPFKHIMPMLIKKDISFTPEIWMGHRNDGEAFHIALRHLKKYGV